MRYNEYTPCQCNKWTINHISTLTEQILYALLYKIILRSIMHHEQNIQIHVKHVDTSGIAQTTTYNVQAQHPIYGKFFELCNIHNITKFLINSTKGINKRFFKRDIAPIMACIRQQQNLHSIDSEQKLHFDTFLFDLNYNNTKLYKNEFLSFDFAVFFLAETDRILNPNSDYAYNHVHKLLNLLESHYKRFLNQDRYFNFFPYDVIRLCLQLRIKYAAKTDVFQKIFCLLINFIRKHECVAGKHIPVYGKSFFIVMKQHFVHRTRSLQIW